MIDVQSPCVVLGRFPPPMDGQTLATERCASFLEDSYCVLRFNTQVPGSNPVHASPRLGLVRPLHFIGLRGRLASTLQPHAATPLIWHSVSPAPLGHLRDVLTTVPAFAPRQPVAAVLHRAGFEALFASPLTARSAARLVRRVQTFVFQSEALAARTDGHVPLEKRRIIPNTIRDELAPSPEAVEARRVRGSSRPAHVLFLSNMLPEKGYAAVLEAVGRLHAEGVPVRATFAGRWPSDTAHAAFLARARQLGVAVEVPGAVTDVETIARLHLDADVFVLPTAHPTETQPIAILEALAAGTPVVALDRAVLRDMITDGVEGRLVRTASPERIAEALADLTAPDHWSQASRAARAKFDVTFSPEIVGAQWRSLVADLAVS